MTMLTVLGIGIHSVDDLLKVSRGELTRICSELSHKDQKQFKKSFLEVRNCFKPEDLELKNALESIYWPTYYSLFSGTK